MKVLMVAAENDAIPGGKVGGIGDVVRDIPIALASKGTQVDVVTPGYGAFSALPGSERVGKTREKRHPMGAGAPALCRGRPGENLL